MQSTEQKSLMKNTQSMLKGLIVCGIALAMAGSLSAQVAAPGTAKVVRIKGNARYTTGNNVYLPLKVGAVLKPGTIVQTAANSFVDIVLGEGDFAMPVMGTTAPTPQVYQPAIEQDIVRLYENTALGIDKLTSMN